jgi:hypothetical protein
MQLGGFANSGSNGGDVNLTSTSALTTSANMSDAIKLQSIGNGGGFAGVGDIYSGSPFTGSSMYLGGGGSGGGNGGTITLNNSSSILTQGSSSLGILAQSIGGGGGDARVTATAPIGLTAALAVSEGSVWGAKGGITGIVNVTNGWIIQTYGLGSDGIVAQSIGDGGGFSALSGVGLSPPTQSSTSGSTYGIATAGAMSSMTVGSDANAAYAGTSIGTYSGSGTAVSTNTGIAIASVLGASSGSSNGGNTVNVTNNGWILTGNNQSVSTGDGSAGIIAQSIGAGGGIARSNLTNFDQSQTTMAMLLGASGSSSGVGYYVTVNNNNQSTDFGNVLQTMGRSSMGILAQSIGGGGGLGMLNASALVGGSANIALALGGTGSSSGTAAAVQVNTGSYITTVGDQSEAIVAQAISNGGGVAKAVIDAASPGLVVGASQPNDVFSNTYFASANTNSGLAIGALLGSSSSAGSTTNEVTVNTSSIIQTSGARSTGIVAQSIGGGGGLVDVTTNSLNSNNFMGSINMGGASAGQGGVGTSTAVNIISNPGSTITTKGDLADGILAQSISFGGGSFGVVDKSASPAGTGSLSFALGQSAISANINANPVTVTTDTITTYGFGSSGVTAQSIGGGGGLLSYALNTSGLSGSGILGGTGSGYTSNGGSVSVTTNYYLATNGAFAPDIIAQSIGGGGGRVVGNQDIYTSTLKLGADGGGGNGGSVTATTTASISTGGSNSPGIITQSIGGGGGLLQQPTSLWTNVNLGGVSGTGGAVTVNANSTIWTYGQGSIGIVAQSIGGGGGLVTMVGTPNFGSAATSGANGGAVTANVNGSIVTNGNAAPGVLAMSVGGGGGAAILSDSIVYGVGAAKGNGNGGNVVVNVNAPITTYGTGSNGVVAVSIAGGGGLAIGTDGVAIAGGLGTGSAGSVQVNVAKNIAITVNGAYSYGIFTAAIKGINDPEVNIAPGASVIGGAGGAGVYFAGSAINTLNNQGAISTSDGLLGRAITSDGGTTTINNSGVTLGSITLGGSGNVLNNLSGARMYLTSSPNLGGDGIFNNAGYLQFNPQGFLKLGVLNQTGTLIQSSSGVLGVKFDHHAGSSDLISIGSGSIMNLGGSISPTLINAGLIAPGTAGPTTIISNNGGTLIADQLGVVNTAIMNYGLVKDSSGVQLTSTANFAPAGLTPNASQVGSAIGTYQTAGSSAFFQAATALLANIPTVGALD